LNSTSGWPALLRIALRVRVQIRMRVVLRAHGGIPRGWDASFVRDLHASNDLPDQSSMTCQVMVAERCRFYAGDPCMPEANLS
jgi:hypothetical protein